MRYSIVLPLCLAWASLAHADGYRTLTDFARQSPAYVAGVVTFQKSHGVFRHRIAGQTVFDAVIRANEPISILLTESKVSLSSKKGIHIRVAGIPVLVTRLTYDDRTGEAQATTSVLGSALESGWIEAKVEGAVEREFGGKLHTAFTHLRSLRSRDTLVDLGRALNAVVDSFKSEPTPGGKPGTPLPTFDGHLALIYPVNRSETLRVGRTLADLEQGDRLSTSVTIHVPSRRKLQIRGIVFTSQVGLKVRAETSSRASLKAMELHGFSVTEESVFSLDASNGIDGVITGAGFLLGAVGGGRKVPESTLVQDMLDAKLGTSVADFAVTNEARLLKVGFTSKLVRSLAGQN